MSRLPYSDIHTHHRTLSGDAVLNVDPVIDAIVPDCPASVGIHPWNSGRYSRVHLNLLRQWALLPQVVAIGEAGLDNLRGAPLDAQMDLLRTHIALSEELEKPLILHIVGAWNEIIALRRELNLQQPWIVHGFRGKPQLARQLLQHGFSLSFGERFNPASVAVTPPDRLYTETDESSLSINDIRAAIDMANNNASIDVILPETDA